MKSFLFFCVAVCAAGVLFAQSADSVSATADSLELKLKLMKLQTISISAPKPLYSMTGEVVNYNVENDPTVEGLTAMDAIRNAPTVSVDEEGNLTMRGSDEVEVWLNGQPTHMSGAVLKAFFESMSATSIARIEVIKNPSAKYMVADGHHILNVVMSARLRTSQLLILGLSGNSRPYLSPWASYVRNTDRLRFHIHLAGSASHHSSQQEGSIDLSAFDDLLSHQDYQRQLSSGHLFGSGNLGLTYKIDSHTDFDLSWWGMLQARYDDMQEADYDQYDYYPIEAHYRYHDSDQQDWAMHNGFVNFDLKHRFLREGHNIKFSGVWNYLFSTTEATSRRLLSLAEGYYLPLLPYDRTSQSHYNRNSVGLSLTYNYPLDSANTLQLRLSGQPYGRDFRDRTILDFDTLASAYLIPDTLRNLIHNSYTRSVSALASLRHEWERATLEVDLYARQSWLRIHNDGRFPDRMLATFLCFEPSASFTYRTPSMHYWRLRYTSSVGTPSGSDLTTSRIYGDDSYTTGSRSIDLSKSHYLNLSWNRYFEHFGNVSIDAYLNRTWNGIESVTRTTDYSDPYLHRIISYSVPINIDGSYKFGADANFTYRPVAWINIRVGGSLFRSGYKADTLYQQRTQWQLNASAWTKIAKLINLSLNANYGSPTIALFTEQKQALTLGLSASATFLDGRLSLNLSLSDILNSNRFDRTVSSPGYASYSTSHRDARYLTFGLTYRFGKLDLQYQVMGGAASE